MAALQYQFYNKTETPCIGICSTIYGDEICRGCFRSCQEVIDWNTYSDPEKLAVLNKLNQRIIQVLQGKMIIQDITLLQAKCQQFNVKIRLEWDPLTWAHALLRSGMDRIQDVAKYGLQIKSPYTNLSIAKLAELIDDELHHVSHCSV